MPHCLVYGCTPKARAAAQAKREKISYHKFPEDRVVRKARIAKIERQKNFYKNAFKGFLSTFDKRIDSEISWLQTIDADC